MLLTDPKTYLPFPSLSSTLGIFLFYLVDFIALNILLTVRN